MIKIIIFVMIEKWSRDPPEWSVLDCNEMTKSVPPNSNHRELCHSRDRVPVGAFLGHLPTKVTFLNNVVFL